jgi:hypothetical protein
MIKITGVDLREFVKAVYDLSRSQGLGALHYTPGPLTDAEADEIVAQRTLESDIPISMDYVRGRACKMTVFQKGDDLFIRGSWFDHSDHQLAELLKRVGIVADAASIARAASPI